MKRGVGEVISRCIGGALTFEIPSIDRFLVPAGKSVPLHLSFAHTFVDSRNDPCHGNGP